MSLLAHYAAMRAAALPRLAQGQAELDPLLDAPTDTRRGITLLARPPAAVAQAISSILADFQAIEPSQYYYPATDLHVTLLSLISCYDGFELASIDAARYVGLVADVLRHRPAFTLDFVGLTASPGGILVQGFPRGEGLAELRHELRRAFRASGLLQTIDQRYSIQTAHLTVVRFRQPLRQPQRLVQALRAHEHTPIGTAEVGRLELVFNDWYQREAHKVALASYQLA